MKTAVQSAVSTGVSKDKPLFSDLDKQANCLSECERSNKPALYRKKKKLTKATSGALYILIIIMGNIADKGSLNYSDPCCHLIIFAHWKKEKKLSRVYTAKIIKKSDKETDT